MMLVVAITSCSSLVHLSHRERIFGVVLEYGAILATFAVSQGKFVMAETDGEAVGSFCRNGNGRHGGPQETMTGKFYFDNGATYEGAWKYIEDDGNATEPSEETTSIENKRRVRHGKGKTVNG